ncbi:retinitis pigmentosa gtpase regulator a-related [Anaeramoeba flamelloides]|uniref:Retinitis pigmentosa gtpase regulator a-related n=1 Tax=Anaeramoeba flamelloides TaxID=1746091 RepID=A0ABQ8YQI1_9EUKA|nr:retinitis pigmentosa gtpase regulator a-related [Anaeramoeba flamelloides]
MAYEYQKGYFRKCEQNFKKIGTNLRTELYLKESIFENLNLKFTSKYWGEEALDQPYETLPNCYGKIIKIQSGYQHYILKTQKGRLYRFGKSVWETRPSRNNLMGYQYLQINYFQNHRLLVKKIYCGYYSSYFLCSNQDLYYCCNINFRRERSEIEKDLSLLNKEFSQSSKQSEVLLEYNKSDRKLNFVLCEQDVEQCWVNQFVPNFFFVKSLSDDNNLYAMGDNQSYQLAIGLAQIHDTIKYEPVKVPFIDSNEIVDMALSSSYTVIVLKKKSQDKHRVFFAGFEKKFFTTFKEAKELTFLKIVKIVSSKNLSIAKSRNNDFWIFDNRIIKKIPNTNYLAQKKYCFKNFRKFEFNKYPIHSNIKISAGIENKFFFYLKSYNDQDLIDDLLKLLISGLCADLTICDGIKVHKIFVETRLKCKSEMIIDKLKKYKKQTIRNFLKYVYTGKIFNEKYYAIIMRILKKFKLSDLSIKSLKEDLVSLYYDESSIDFNILIKNKTNLNTGTENNNKSSNTNTNKKNNNDDEKNKHNNNKNNTNNNHNNNKSLTINQENVLNNNENDREGEFIKKFNPQSNILNKKSNNQNRKNQNEKNQIKNKNKSLHNFPDGKMKNDNFFESLIKNKNNKKKNNNQKKNKHENRNRNHKSKNNYNTTNNKNKKKTNNNKIPEQSKNNLKNKNCFEILINNKKNIKKNNNQKKNNQKSLIKINNNKKKQAKNNPNYNYNNTKKKKKKKKKKNNVKKLNNNKKNNNDKNNKANNNNNITKKCNSNNKNNNNDEKNKHNKNTNKNKNNTNNNQNNNRGKNDYYYNNNNTTNKNKNDKNNNKNNKAISSRNDNNNNQNNNSKNMECDNNNKNNDRDEKNKHNNNDDDQKNKNKNKNSNNNKGCSGISSFNDNNNNQNNNSKNMECDNNKKNNDRDEKNKRKNNLHIKRIIIIIIKL